MGVVGNMTALALPQTRDVRWWWVEGRDKGVTSEAASEQFDRWLAARDAEVRAKALEDFATEHCDRNVEHALTSEARHFAKGYGQQARERAAMIREGRA